MDFNTSLSHYVYKPFIEPKEDLCRQVGGHFKEEILKSLTYSRLKFNQE